MEKIKNIFFKCLIIFLVIYFLTANLIPQTVYAEDFKWAVSEKDQIYKRWNGKWYLYYHIGTQKITTKRLNYFKSKNNSNHEDEDKYLIYYYRPNEKLDFTVKNEIKHYTDDKTRETVISFRDNDDNPVTENKDPIVVKKGKTYAGQKEIKYGDIATIATTKTWSDSTDFKLKFNNVFVSKEILSREKCFFEVFAGVYDPVDYHIAANENVTAFNTKMLLIKCVPYCTITIDAVVDAGYPELTYKEIYQNIKRSDSNAASKELEKQIKKIYKDDKEGYVLVEEDSSPKIINQTGWRDDKAFRYEYKDINNNKTIHRAEGAIYKGISVLKKKDNREYSITYDFVYIGDCGRLYWKQGAIDDVTDLTDEERKDLAEQRFEEAENEISTKLKTVIATIVAGEDRAEKPFTGVLDDINYYEIKDEEVPAETVSLINKVLTWITNIGIVLSVLMLAILGIKYMLGSVEEKADYKAGLIPYIVGIFLLLGISTILKILMNFGVIL